MFQRHFLLFSTHSVSTVQANSRNWDSPHLLPQRHPDPDVHHTAFFSSLWRFHQAARGPDRYPPHRHSARMRALLNASPHVLLLQSLGLSSAWPVLRRVVAACSFLGWKIGRRCRLPSRCPDRRLKHSHCGYHDGMVMQ